VIRAKSRPKSRPRLSIAHRHGLINSGNFTERKGQPEPSGHGKSFKSASTVFTYRVLSKGLPTCPPVSSAKLWHRVKHARRHCLVQRNLFQQNRPTARSVRDLSALYSTARARTPCSEPAFVGWNASFTRTSCGVSMRLRFRKGRPPRQRRDRGPRKRCASMETQGLDSHVH